MRRRSRWGPACAVVLAGSVLACAPVDPAGGGGLADDLAALPGVRDAAAGEVELDQDVRGTEAVVDLEAGPTIEEVAAVVEAIAAADVDRSAVYVGAGDVDYRPVAGEGGLSGLWQIGEDADADRVAEELVAGTALLVQEGVEGTVVVDLTSYQDPTITTPLVTLDAGPVGVDEVTSIAEAVARDGVLSDAVVAVRGAEDSDGESVTLRTGADGMTAEVLTTWDEVVAAAEAATGVQVLPSYRVEGGVGLAAIEATVSSPRPVPLARLTPEAYGDELRPMIRGMLDAFEAQPGGARLDVGYEGRPLVSVSEGRRLPALSGVERRWNRESYAYLESLR